MKSSRVGSSRILRAAFFALAAFASPCLVFGETAPSQRPNIVFILADDLGYGDVHAFNPMSKIPTPNFDELAEQGMMFSDAHSGCAVCTPTRYGVLTGRYSWRTRLKRGVLNGYSSHLIDPNRQTIASLLQQQGYHTACVGKWHLGMDFPKGTGQQKVDYSGVIEHGPNTNGFDYFYGIAASLDFPPYVYMENNRFVELASERFAGSPFPAYLRAGEQGPSFKHIETLDHLTAKATDYLKRRSKTDKPFFVRYGGGFRGNHQSGGSASRRRKEIDRSP